MLCVCLCVCVCVCVCVRACMRACVHVYQHSFTIVYIFCLIVMAVIIDLIFILNTITLYKSTSQQRMNKLSPKVIDARLCRVMGMMALFKLYDSIL